MCYQEFDVPKEFPLELRQYLPNINYKSDAQRQVDEYHCLMILYVFIFVMIVFNWNFMSCRPLRTVVLVSLRDIKRGEELFSNYYTIVH